MSITIEKSGGFAGLRKTFTLDDSSLTAEDSGRLASLLEAADFFNLPEQMRSAEPSADRFQYKVAIDHDQRRHMVRADEAAIPPGLHDLIRWVLEKAR